MNATIQDLALFMLPEVSEALSRIKEDGLDNIYCQQTGVVMGTILDKEIIFALNYEQNRNSNITVRELYDSWTMRHLVACSRTSPLMAYHQDKHTARHLMRMAPNRLFAYLAGRLIFDGLTADRHHGESEYQLSRLYYRIELQDRLAELPFNWAHSLTAQDEEVSPAQAANLMFADIVMAPATESEEVKSAQRCMELMLRLETIHKLSSIVYIPELRAKLLALREFDESRGYFTSFRRVLEEVEASAIVKTHTMRGFDANRMLLSAAMDAINEEVRRVRDMLDLYDKKQQVVGSDKYVHLFEVLRRYVSKDTQLDTQSVKIVSETLNILYSQLARRTFSDKRVEELRSKYNRANGATVAGNTQVRKGTIQALSDLVENLASARNPLAEVYEQKLNAAIAIRDEKKNKAPSKPRKTKVLTQNQLDIIAAFTAAGLNFGKES